MSARDIIAGELPGCRTDFSYQLADAILSALTASGYRILGPVEKREDRYGSTWYSITEAGRKALSGAREGGEK